MKKKRLEEKMGGGNRIGLGGVNSTGPNYNVNRTKHPSGYHTGGYQGSPDSQFSQRLALSSTIEEDEEIDDQDMLEEDEETLYEFFSRIAKLNILESEEKELEDSEIEDSEIEEISAAGIGGVVGKFGLYNSDGSKTTHSQYKEKKLKQKEWK
jgi:hypothetical protein